MVKNWCDQSGQGTPWNKRWNELIFCMLAQIRES